MADVRLRPCPNCGRRELWWCRYPAGPENSFRFWHFIKCPGCGCRSIPTPSGKEAAAYWCAHDWPRMYPDRDFRGSKLGRDVHWFVPVGARGRALLREENAQICAGVISCREVVAREICARTVCKRRTANPKGEGWLWMEFEPEPPKTGWYCPDCAKGLQAVLEAHGVKPVIDRLQ